MKTFADWADKCHLRIYCLHSYFRHSYYIFIFSYGIHLWASDQAYICYTEGQPPIHCCKSWGDARLSGICLLQSFAIIEASDWLMCQAEKLHYASTPPSPSMSVPAWEPLILWLICSPNYNLYSPTIIPNSILLTLKSWIQMQDNRGSTGPSPFFSPPWSCPKSTPSLSCYHIEMLKSCWHLRMLYGLWKITQVYYCCLFNLLNLLWLLLSFTLRVL